MNIADLLEAATSSDDAEASKPEPDIFEAALRKIGNPDPDRCVVVGDTPYDAIAAGKINLPTVGVLSGGFPERGLTDAGCVEIYRDPADLLERYDESVIAGIATRAATHDRLSGKIPPAIPKIGGFGIMLNRVAMRRTRTRIKR
jgi:beta-phosphoglucomutase-like phosphatase (HAD superfamily)